MSRWLAVVIGVLALVFGGFGFAAIMSYRDALTDSETVDQNERRNVATSHVEERETTGLVENANSEAPAEDLSSALTGSGSPINRSLFDRDGDGVVDGYALDAGDLVEDGRRYYTLDNQLLGIGRDTDDNGLVDLVTRTDGSGFSVDEPSQVVGHPLTD